MTDVQTLPAALAALAAYPQFIIYKLVPKAGRINKTDKLPVDFRTGQVFVAGMDWQNDPTAMTTVANVLPIAAALGESYGVGFLFTRNDPFFFLDIDNCMMPDGQWSPLALDLVQRVPGAAVEVSQSGKGLHIFGTGTVPEHACKNIAAGLELYTESRFVALTGNRARGNAGLDCSAAMAAIVPHYFPPKITQRGDEWTTKPVPNYTPVENDEVLIKKALATSTAANKFGGKASFADLWNRNVQVLAENYPDPEGVREYDASSADAALAQHLAFWTGCNCSHMQNLMWCSGLVRDKWSRDDYIQATITRAVSLQGVVYTGNAPRVSVDAVKPDNAVAQATVREGFQFLAAAQQVEYFAGCVYIQDMHRILTPAGTKLKPEVFNATYGGYVFQLDAEASGKVTKKAFEAFTESQVVNHPKAESTCFRPDLPAGTLINDEGRTLVNTYVEIITPRAKGDATPFLNHLAKLLPNQRDRDILLSYMAAIIQYKGTKFQWAPLIQGVEGNGKTLFTRCVAFAIGKKYTHFPKADDIDNKFNGWIQDRLFIGVEDVYVPDHRREILEALKPMITNTEIEIQLKGVDQITAVICANFILNSNHKDALRKTRNDRRFAIFFTAQQNDVDIIRDGMGGNYFPNLYDWLRGGGYAIVADYLAEFAIPDELNPAKSCHRAPVTTSTSEAIAASLGGIEQEVQEAIDEGRPGFAGGWVSSMAFDALLHDLGAARRLPPNRRREVLQSLGYDWHPALPRGRVSTYVMIDKGKPRLFIKDGHIHANLKTPAEVARMYSENQGAAIGQKIANQFSEK